MSYADEAAAAFWERRRVGFQLDGQGGALVMNRDTGYRWVRGPRARYGVLWQQMSPRPAGATTRAAMLIAHPDTRGGDLAAVLRTALAEPWPSLLRRAESIARDEIGVSAERIRVMHDLVTAIMVASELLPHRVVLVVDDSAALAASYRADAALAATHVEATGYRYSASVCPQVGERDVRSPDLARELLLPRALEIMMDLRPGQRLVVEPAALVSA